MSFEIRVEFNQHERIAWSSAMVALRAFETPRQRERAERRREQALTRFRESIRETESAT